MNTPSKKLDAIGFTDEATPILLQVCSVRILNLGVLVCVGGVLAALPFRHADDAGNEPARATGPTVCDDNLYGNELAVQACEPSVAADDQALKEILSFRPDTPVAQTHPSRPPMNLPLTYEDLAVPLKPSGIIDERFDAVLKRPSTSEGGSPPRRPGLTRRDLWTTLPVAPRGQDAASPETNTEQTLSGLTPATLPTPLDPSTAADRGRPDGSVTPSVSKTAKTNFASSTLPPPEMQRPADSPTRIRHWIRQP